MKRLFALIFVLAALAVSVSAQTVAFTNVNVIPMDRERVLANQTVVIKNGVIAEIGDTKKVKLPKDAVRVDGTGKYLIPGLVDMHTHLLSDSNEFPDSIGPHELRVMVANGVTTVRFMIGTPELLALRSRSAGGKIEAPTIFVASPHLTGREQGNNFIVNTPEEAREAVRKSKAAGYDFIKVTTFIKPEVYEAAVDEAAMQNIRVVGHADSRFVGVERAWKAKQQIEHLDGYMELLLREDAPMKGSVSDLYIYNPENWKSFDYVDENKIPEIARKTVAASLQHAYERGASRNRRSRLLHGSATSDCGASVLLRPSTDFHYVSGRTAAVRAAPPPSLHSAREDVQRRARPSLQSIRRYPSAPDSCAGRRQRCRIVRGQPQGSTGPSSGTTVRSEQPVEAVQWPRGIDPP